MENNAFLKTRNKYLSIECLIICHTKTSYILISYTYHVYESYVYQLIIIFFVES